MPRQRLDCCHWIEGTRVHWTANVNIYVPVLTERGTSAAS